MQLSTTPTNYIIVKANTQSEWDNIDFALINITKEYQEDVKKRLVAVLLVSKVSTFENISFDNDVDYWFQENDDETLGTITPDFPENLFWSFVEVTLEEIEKLIPPEQNIRYGSMRVFKDNLVMFTASGKHTGEEFWTENIDLSFLLN